MKQPNRKGMGNAEYIQVYVKNCCLAEYPNHFH